MTETNTAPLFENGLVKSFGRHTGHHLDQGALERLITDMNDRRLDVVADRRSVQATVDNNGLFGLNIAGMDDTFRLTTVAARQLSEKTKIPLDFMRENIARYPSLAATMVNTWWTDDQVVNRVGSARARKRTVQAQDMMHLIRLFRAGDTPAVMRAILSNRYMVVNNSDIMSFMHALVTKSGIAAQMTGSFTDEKMFVRFRMPDVTSAIEFKNRGKGHEPVRIPCGASLLVSNSDVGIGRLVVQPELEVIVCSNLLRVTESLSQIHVGRELEDMGVLSDDTVRRMTEALFGRLRDVATATLSQDTFDRLADNFSRNAGLPVSNAVTVVQNVTKKFGLGEDLTQRILDKFVDEGMANRFGLAQAVTFQAHAFRDDDFEKATLIEDAGSKLLAMPEATFQKELTVDAA